MNYALTEQVRKLPTQYDTVKAGTESMFNTLRDGLSNTLSAALSGDIEKMKDSWKEFLTTIKNTFLKMISDLIVNNLMKSLFGGLLGQENKEKGDFLKDAIGTKGGSGLQVLPGLVVPNPADFVKTIADPLAMASTTTASMLTSTMTPAIGLATSALGTFSSALAYAASAASAQGGGGEGSFMDLFGFGQDSPDNSYMDFDEAGELVEYIPGAANGGVVSAPTLAMIGEGRSNEAIVPMPNGRAIPVDMRNNGGGGAQSLTVINVVDASIMDEFVAKNPAAIINIIAADTMHGGQTYQAMKAKNGR
jgi:hypothetical protein